MSDFPCNCLSCGMYFDVIWPNDGHSFPVFCPFCGDNDVDLKEASDSEGEGE
jgi:hypothetical protein